VQNQARQIDVGIEIDPVWEIFQQILGLAINMGFRFRRSIRVFPGVRINLSKTGIGFSAGVKGLRITKRADGKIQKTVSLPGTGLSYVDIDGAKSNSAAKPKEVFKCPNCGRTYKPTNDSFCSKCGTQF